MNQMDAHLLTKAEEALNDAGIGFTVIAAAPALLPFAA